MRADQGQLHSGELALDTIVIFRKAQGVPSATGGFLQQVDWPIRGMTYISMRPVDEPFPVIEPHGLMQMKSIADGSTADA
ncbi:MAG: hypothetical protein KatS3mg111_0350 [Pirellulaceae bacterium]|nr:MAG: hypothetical protein KatS3mg111_0350 [Pirellulaceae bacterium]